MNNQHTPEPWAWQQFGKEWCLTGQHGMRPIILAVRKGALTSLKNGLLVPLDTSHPDARLIAAAPDMLKALEAFVHNYRTSEDMVSAFEMAKAAIAQAKY